MNVKYLFVAPATAFLRTLLLAFLLVSLVGCAYFIQASMRSHFHNRYLGSIDLSSKGAKCESVFQWNSYFPSLSLALSDTNGATRPVGTNPSDWPLAVQLEVFDGDKLVVSSHIGQRRMVFSNWNLPATGLVLLTPDFDNTLHAGRSYKFVLSVLQEENNLGTAKVYAVWATGGDSM